MSADPFDFSDEPTRPPHRTRHAGRATDTAFSAGFRGAFGVIAAFLVLLFLIGAALAGVALLVLASRG